MSRIRIERVVFAAIGAVAACGFDGVATGPSDPASGPGGAAVDGGGPDGTEVLVGPADGASADASTGACPPVCNDGCAGGECRIKNPSSPTACPPGMACRVECGRQQVCRDVDCSAATRCTLTCTADQACDNLKLTCGSGPCALSCTVEEACKNLSIAPGGASALCLACKASESCSNVACVAAATNGGCSGSCGGVSNCGALATALTCP